MALVEVSQRNRGMFEFGCVLSTALLGALLGMKRRVGSIFFAPIVNWIVAWAPLWIASIVRYGLFHGFFNGLALITVGWFAISAAEIIVLLASATVFRALFSGSSRNSDGSDIVIIGPNDIR